MQITHEDADDIFRHLLNDCYHWSPEDGRSCFNCHGTEQSPTRAGRRLMEFLDWYMQTAPARSADQQTNT